MLVNVSPVGPAIPMPPRPLPALYVSPTGRIGMIWEDSKPIGVRFRFVDLVTGETVTFSAHPDDAPPGASVAYTRLAVGRTVTLSNDD